MLSGDLATGHLRVNLGNSLNQKEMAMKKIVLALYVVIVAIALKPDRAEACKWCTYSPYGCIDDAVSGYTGCSSYYNPWAPNGWTCNLFGSC